jgi:hypothetical protein
MESLQDHCVISESAVDHQWIPNASAADRELPLIDHVINYKSIDMCRPTAMKMDGSTGAGGTDIQNRNGVPFLQQSFEVPGVGGGFIVVNHYGDF